MGGFTNRPSALDRFSKLKDFSKRSHRQGCVRGERFGTRSDPHAVMKMFMHPDNPFMVAQIG